MSLDHEELTLEAVIARLTKLEEANARVAELESTNTQLQAELATLRNAQLLVPENEQIRNQKTLLPISTKAGRSRQRAGRRGILKKMLAVGTVTVGAAALLQSQAGKALADGNEGPTTFTGTSTQPAVTANGTGSEDAIDVNADSGRAINAFSLSGIAINALGGGFKSAIQATSDRGIAMFALSNSTTGVYGQSTSGAGMVAISNSGDGLFASSVTSNGVVAKSSKGIALSVIGTIQVTGHSVGQAILPAGSTSVTITSKAATPISNILLTPLADPAGRLWLRLGSGTFTINSSSPPTSDVPIEYFIIN
jgi:hypothetical protein